jgi:hypothetical protein
MKDYNNDDDDKIPPLPPFMQSYEKTRVELSPVSFDQSTKKEEV